MKAAPVSGDERILSLDIIRGFALLGIFLVNMPTFIAPEFIRQMYSLPEALAPLDQAVRLFFDMFVQTKFYTIFSFLFGLGFFIFMSRVEKKGLNVNRLFSRRLLILLLLGLWHLVFLWYGDILHTYALIGFLLLLFYKRSNKAVIGWAFGLTILFYALTIFQLLLISMVPVTYLGEQQAIGEEKLVEALRIYQDASYAEWLAYRLEVEITTIIGNIPFLILILLPLFLFGLYAGRQGILHEPAKHIGFIKRVWRVTLICSVPSVVMVALLHFDALSFGAGQETAHQLFVTLSGLTLCFFYISSLVILLQKPVWQKRLRPLGLVGQMALTNYLLQTIISVLIINLFDLFNRISLSTGLLLSLVIYFVLVLFSSFWLKRYRFGPFEWLWRSLTYGYLQPLKRSERQQSS